MVSKSKSLIKIYACYLIYSLSLVAAKFAGGYPLFSINAIGLYFMAIVCLGFFALVWQQVLKSMPLTVAYANRAVTIIYGMLFGAVLFSERITWNMILGAVVILCGIVLMVSHNE